MFFLCTIISQLIISGSIKASITENKKNELTSVVADYSVSPATVSINDNHRVFVLDTSLHIVSDSSDIENLTGKTLYLPATVSALSGNSFFDCDITSDAIQSVLSTPLLKDGSLSGVLVVFEHDKSTSALLGVLKNSVALSFVFAFLLVSVLVITISVIIRRKVKSLVLTVNKAREKDWSGSVFSTSNDEFSPIFAEFNNLYERLDYTQKMRQAFVSDASHELRTPLAAIKLLSESITHYDNIDADTYKEFMQDIILEVDRMSHTAEKLLILSKLDNLTATPKLAPVSLTEIVHKMISFLMPIADKKNVRIEAHIEDDCIILGDMEAVNQVIGNLIDNGIKYNNPNGELRIYLFTKNSNCIFIIDDTGIGIPAEFREKVFDRFFRIDASRHHDGRGGSGLGLSIVKHNVKALGGSISISDSINGGTRFTVVFPSMSFDKEDF